jgi:D-alanyl-D-alanine carboxypeptidase
MKRLFIILIFAILLFSGCAIKVPTSSALSSAQETVGLNTILAPSTETASDVLESVPPEIAAQSTAKSPTSTTPTSEAALPTFTRNAEFDWALILVNKNNVLPDTYKPEIVEYNSTRKIEARALSYLQAMVKDAKLDGIELNVISSYRSPERQVELFNAKVEEFMDAGNTRETAEVEAAKMVAPPGTSEHCTGLAVDIVSTDWYEGNKSLTSKFKETDEFKWLIANCAKYGFIMRYPEGKEDITMIDYEPWHYRFVGPDNARYIMDNGLTLEEFLALFK